MCLHRGSPSSVTDNVPRSRQPAPSKASYRTKPQTVGLMTIRKTEAKFEDEKLRTYLGIGAE